MGAPPQSHRQRVAATWERFWRDSAREQAIADTFAHYRVLPAGARLVASIACEHVGDVRGKRVLDAGCGSGLASLILARAGAEVTMLDVSSSAVAGATRRAAAWGVDATVIQGSIFELPFEAGAFDLVWNTGVLEHFEPPDQTRALIEMIRVATRTGLVLTLNPNAACGLYSRLQQRAMRSGAWDVGYERAFATLADVVPEGARLEERSAGLLSQFHYVKYLLPAPLRIPYLMLHEAVQLVAFPLNRLSGSLLVSAIRPPVS